MQKDIWDNNISIPNIDEIKDAFKNPPDYIEMNIRLQGKSAHRFHFAKTILSSVFKDYSEEEIIAYLVRQGAEKEIEKLSHIWSKIQD